MMAKDDKALPESQQKKLPADDTPQLDQGEQKPQLEDGQELAKKALQAVNASDENADSAKDEAQRSDDLAQTLNSLQNLIERHANELTNLKNELSEKRQELRNYFENDTQLAEAKEKSREYSKEMRERKSKLQSDPQVTALKVNIKDINTQKKELEDTLSDLLVNYHSITQSKSFDTSDGDQWEFKIKAKIKTKRK